MTSPRLATYSIGGVTGYGAVTDAGIVDLSACFGKDYPTLREAIAASAVNKLAETPRSARRTTRCCDRWQPSIAGKIICIGVGYRTATPNTRTAGRTEISEHVHADAALVRRLRPAIRPRARHSSASGAVLVISEAGRHQGGDALAHIAAIIAMGHIRDWVRHAKFSVRRASTDSTGSLGPWLRLLVKRSDIRLSTRSRRDAAGRPHGTIDLRLPVPHQLPLDLHHAGARRRHRNGNANRRRCAVRPAALSQARGRHRG